MPLLNVTLSGEPDDALAAAVAAALGDLTARILRKDPAVTAVCIAFVPASRWFTGGVSLAAKGAASFSLDIVVVDGTNTKDEKAAYLDAVFAAMAELLPNLDPESYILVREVKADAYGYGGRTQERRYVERRYGTRGPVEAGRAA
ncbi:tautomerase family protein [Xanthobacter agilis]|jgi:4-oxalocrotonate tautomerase|uniref:4-oxalocrotonate tautomerase n=1 Tax=Xanthobacter agilis TaxID=47492 RepID=A0ABU0LG31_XANAG|nr:4-oxalocrotonate tautomerase [Xanthobacter agilis]MDQ0506101.1 4-oxalocrotonate tautomerase [Xanthobacter agilis]